MGRTVVFEVGPVTMLISELRGVAGNLPDVYRAFGIEPARLQDGGAQDRLELPVLRADHLAGHPRRHARPRPVGHRRRCRGGGCRGRSIRSIRSPTGARAARRSATGRAERDSRNRDRQEGTSHETRTSSSPPACSACALARRWRPFAHRCRPRRRISRAAALRVAHPRATSPTSIRSSSRRSTSR